MRRSFTKTFTSAKVVALMFLLAASLAHANDNVNVDVTVSGEITPGVYGRIELGNKPPPPVIYTKPVIITKVKHSSEPIYLHVPPGHEKHWDKHCAEYHACDREVYFVKSTEHAHGEKEKHHEYKKHRDDDDEGDDDSDHGHGHRHD
jgi:hypothetical protein